MRKSGLDGGEFNPQAPGFSYLSKMTETIRAFATKTEKVC